MPVRDARNITANEQLNQMSAAMSGDLVLQATPATTGSSKAAIIAGQAGDGFFRTVNLALVDSNGKVQEWFNGTFPISVSDTTAGDGTSAIVGSLTEATFVDGRADIQVEYIDTWDDGDTNTFTLGNTSSLLGFSLANKTSVDTIVA